MPNYLPTECRNKKIFKEVLRKIRESMISMIVLKYLLWKNCEVGKLNEISQRYEIVWEHIQ